MRYREFSFDKYGIYTVQVVLIEGCALKVVRQERSETKVTPRIRTTPRMRRALEYVVIIGGGIRRSTHLSPA